MLKSVQTLFLFILAGSFLTASARADFLLHPWEEHHQDERVFGLDARFNYATTSTNYFSSGVSYTPTGLNSASRMEPDFTLTYGFSDKFSFYARATWENVTLNDPTSKYNGSINGFGDQTIGANYQILPRTSIVLQPSVSFQLQADIPAYSNGASDASFQPYLGDQTIDVTAGVHARLPLWMGKSSTLTALAGAGYTYRTSGFSADLPWSAYVEYRPMDEGFFAKAGGFGFLSLKTDTFDPVTGLASRPTNATGGSYYANAIDPTVLNLQGYVGYRLHSGLEVYAVAADTIYGVSAPILMTFAGGLTFRFGSGLKEEENAAFLSPSQYGKSNQGFVNYGLTAKILRANDRLNLVKIDKGNQDGVKAGEVFDIFIHNSDGSLGEAIARGKVTSVKPNEAALTISEYFKEVWIEEGFIAKRPIP